MILILKTYLMSFIAILIVTVENVSDKRPYLTVENRIQQGLEARESDIASWAIDVIRYGLTEIHTLEEIYNQLELLAKSPYGHVKLQNLTFKRSRARLTATTAEGNYIPYINISIGSYVQKPAIVVVAGIRGCDWLGVAAIMNLIHELVLNYEENYEYTNKVTWVIIPVLNPDGYNATVNNLGMRNWPKNMFKPLKEKKCFGVDLGKNFEYQWLNYDYKNASWCDKDYADRPFSQNESKALRDTIRDHLDTAKIYVSIKQKKRAIMYPFRYSHIKPLFWEIYESIVKTAAEAAFDQHNRFCDYGHVLEFHKKTSGDIDDWVKAHLGLSLGFTYEVSNQTDNKKNIGVQEIKWTNDEVFAALKVIATMGIDFEEKTFLPSLHSENCTVSNFSNSFILTVVFILMVTECKIQ